jgi:hypothetical protein
VKRFGAFSQTKLELANEGGGTERAGDLVAGSLEDPGRGRQEPAAAWSAAGEAAEKSGLEQRPQRPVQLAKSSSDTGVKSHVKAVGSSSSRARTPSPPGKLLKWGSSSAYRPKIRRRPPSTLVLSTYPTATRHHTPVASTTAGKVVSSIPAAIAQPTPAAMQPVGRMAQSMRQQVGHSRLVQAHEMTGGDG